jgi:hypothetical protein
VYTQSDTYVYYNYEFERICRSYYINESCTLNQIPTFIIIMNLNVSVEVITESCKLNQIPAFIIIMNLNVSVEVITESCKLNQIPMFIINMNLNVSVDVITEISRVLSTRYLRLL